MSTSLADEVLARARGDDATCVDLLGRVDDLESLGELIVAVHATGTPAAARAVADALRRPLRRGAWQGFKRLFKLLEARLRDDERDPPERDLALFAQQVHTLDEASWGGSSVSWRTLAYLQRRAYRALKALAHRRPARFRALLLRLLPRYGPHATQGTSALLARVLRGPGPDVLAPGAARFVAPVDNAFAALPSPAGPDLLALGDDELLRPTPPPPVEVPALAPPPPRWRGPIFVERWVEDPAWLIELLERTAYEPAALAIVRLCDERVGDGLLAVPLERFYALLRHPAPAAWRLGLSQVAARARHDRLRWGELVRLLERAAREASPPDWAVIADVLAVMDASDDAAEAEWPGLLPVLHDLLVRHPGEPGVDPIVDVLRRRLYDRLLPPRFGWSTALALVAAPRPALRALGRDLVAACADLEPLDADLLERLLAGALPEDDPDLVQRVLVAPRAVPGGYRPALAERTRRDEVRPAPWPLSRCAAALDRLPEAGFQALRRALLTFDEGAPAAPTSAPREPASTTSASQEALPGSRGDGQEAPPGSVDGLDPRVALALVARPERRTRAVGLELLGGALARGAHPVVELPRLLSAPHEDVVVWARERLEADAAAGRLPNEALYRVLDAGAADAQAFGRELVRAHLERFALAELIVFCAESPDAATSDLGIGLYERRLRDQAGFDLRALVPMFRILLYRPATARAEKERLHGTLRRWALEAADHARLVVDVVGELRRTESRVDRSRAVQLLALIAERFAGEVDVPFRTTAVFDGRGASAWTSR